MFEAILLKVATVFANSTIHIVGDLSKPQTWSNIPMNKLSPCRRPRIVNNPG
jgi:hypothetical protein